MKRSILRTLFILLVVIVAGAFSNRSGKVTVNNRPTRHVSFIDNYLNSINFIKY